MKNCYYLIIISSFISVGAMENPIEPKKRAAQEELEAQELKSKKIESEPTSDEQSAFDRLPTELKKLIVSFLVTSTGATQYERLYTAVTNIRSLMMINKQWKELIEDPEIHSYLIKELANRYTGGDFLEAAIALATRSAGKAVNEMQQTTAESINTRLLKAALNNDYTTVNFLLNSVDTIDQNILNQTFWTLSDHPKVSLPTIKNLLQKGADINSADEYGQTALFKASSNHNSKLVSFLLAHGANPNKASTNKDTPLLATFRPDKILFSKGDQTQDEQAIADIITTLIKYNADINAADDGGTTALHSAVINNQVQATMLLLHYKANPNTVDSEGNTPLISAIKDNYYFGLDLQILKALLEAGAATDPVDSEGHNALWHAYDIVKQAQVRNKNPLLVKYPAFKINEGTAQQAIKLLQQYGAK